MKRILTSLTFAAFATVLVATPAFAQEKQKEDKHKDKHETIVIMRKGDKDEKVVVEFKGDKLIVNGKEVDEFESENLSISRNKLRDLRAFSAPNGNWGLADFEGNNGFRMFSEDENRAMLGVTTEKVDRGAEIKEVSKESAAEKAGLKAGDIITKIDETKIEDADDLSKAIHSHKPGDKVSVSYLRDNKEQKVSAELGKWKGIKFDSYTPDFHFEMPEYNVTPRIRGNGAFMYGGAPKLGLSVQDTDDGKGVKVIEVDEESNAAKAGLKEEDVITHINDKEVNAADEVAKIVKESKEKPSIMVKINRGGKTQNVELKMPRKLKTADL
jgi:serine protease Do